MESGFLNQFLNLVGSPLGLLGLLFSLGVVYRARRSPRLAWFLVALCCFAASLSEFRDAYILDAPDLVFPLEQIRANGRPLTISLLGLVLILNYLMPRERSWRHLRISSAVWALTAIQFLVFFKTFAFGSVSFATLALLTFMSVVLMVRSGPSRWLQNDQQFHLGIWAIALVSLLFISVSGYQALFDPYPVTFVHRSFLGTTGNPQHAATLLATALPCLLFLIQAQTKYRGRISWLIPLILATIALFLTASRTGVLMGGVTLMLFFRQSKGQVFWLCLLMALILAIFLPEVIQAQGTVNFSAITRQLFNLDDTRSQVWAAMWRTFNAHPLFGVPLEADRLGYGENSWLAVAATLGIVGLVPLLIFGFSCLRMIFKLNQMATDYPVYATHSNTVIAGLLTLLVGSIFEAFLLGTITFPLLALLLYLALGQYLLDLHQTYQARLRSPHLNYSFVSTTPDRATRSEPG